MFNSAQTFRKRNYVKPSQKILSILHISFQIERQHSAESGHLFFRQFMLRVLC